MTGRRAAAALGAWLGLWACAGGGAPAGGPERVPEPAAPTAAAAPPVPAALPDLSGRDGAPEHVLLVTVDGLTPAAYLTAPGAEPWMPLLSRLARAGVAADAVWGAAPALGDPAHATLVTGRPPAEHGVTGDRRLGPEGVSAVGHRDASDLRVPALWEVARDAGLRVAVLGWPTTVGAAVDWLYPELFPSRLGETPLGLLEESATPALVARARALGADRPETAYPGPARDALLVDLACEVLTGDPAPRLLLLRLSQTAPVLARHGPEGPAVRDAFASVDASLGRLVGCLEAAERLEATALWVAGDAAVQAVHTWIQPNAFLAEAGLVTPADAARTRVARWDALARSNGTSAFVYARDEESAVLARRALREAAAATRAFRVVSAEEMLALGADREAWFGLEALAGFAFGEGLRGPAVQPAPVRGAAGALSPATGSATGLVAWGRGVRTGIRVPRMRQTDVAPTLARLLDLPLPPGDGRVLVGLLRASAAGTGPARAR